MKYITLIFLMVFSLTVRSQDTLVTYFDSQWKKVSKENATYYRIAYKNSSKMWVVNDFFLQGQIQMKGTYLTRKLKKRHGHFTFYFENGMKQSERQYIKNKPVGKWVWWYETGNMKRKGEFNKKGKKIGYWKGWYENGNLDFEGKYLYNKRENEWKWYFDNGQMSAKEIYRRGKQVGAQYWNRNGSKVESNIKAEVKPEFIGGPKELINFLHENIKYPEEAKLEGISGRVYIRFFIGIDGKIEDPKVIKSVCPTIDKEALRVVKKMPKWIPGKKHNRPERIPFILRLKFKLKWINYN